MMGSDRRPSQVPLLVLALDFPPRRGGIQTFLGELCAAGLRVAPRVVAPATPDAAAFDGTVRYPITRARPLPVPGIGGNAAVAGVALAAIRTSSSHRPRYILAGHVRLGPVAALLAAAWRVPFAVLAYGREVGRDRVAPLRAAQAWALRRAARVVAISAFTAGRVAQCGAAAEAICLVRPGVAARYLAAPVNPAPSRRWVEAGRPVLLTVARLEQTHKGHDTVIQALPAIARAVPEVAYVVAGTGRLEPALRHLAGSLDVADRVIFTGAVGDEELVALYDRCDLLVMPSRATAIGDVEGFGIVFLEAAARGKPVLAGRAGGVADAVVDRQTGVLLDEPTSERFAAAAIQLLQDRAWAQALGAAGARRAREEFNWRAVAARFETCLLGPAG